MLEHAPIVTVLGKRGSGKTFLTKERIIPELPLPVFILDSLAEYRGGVVYNSVDAWYARLSTDTRGCRRWIFRLTEDEQVDLFFKAVWYVEGCSVVIEEADLFCSPFSTTPSLDRLVRYGRHKAITMVFISRRAAEISRNVTAQSDQIITFRQTEPRDIATLNQVDSSVDYSALGQYDYAVLGERLFC